VSLRFAISMHAARDARLDEAHLAACAIESFTRVGLVACRTHIDYGDPQTAGGRARWNRRIREVHGDAPW
jgi:hypothetical protein